MITSIAIENFKAIRDRVAFELKPITLLFGPNSSGKSSVIHALHYAREVFERHNLDPDQTVVGGKFIDLGGFRTLVHGHDLSRSVVLRFDMQWDRRVLFAFDQEFFDRITEFVGVAVENLFTRLKTAAVTLEIACSTYHNRVYVRQYEVEFDGRLFVEIRHDPDRQVTAITRLDAQHPVLLRPRDMASINAASDDLKALTEVHGDLDRSILEACLEEVRPLLPFTGDGSIPLQFLEDALPDFQGRLRFVTEGRSIDEEEDQTQAEVQRKALLDELMVALTRMILIPGKSVKRSLEELCYLGPLRETLPRNFSPVRYPDPSRWANGFAAWDLLSTDLELARRVSDRMSGQDSLGLGYTIRIKQYKELALDSALMVLLQSDRAFDELEDIRRRIAELPTRTAFALVEEGTNIEVLPQDVGVGVSQLIPVVVLAVKEDIGLATVEQPELHVHPAVQVRLGDLFILQVASSPTRQFLLETHSEHLLLRLLRRIRETTDGELPQGHPGLKPEQLSVVYVEPGDEQDRAEGDQRPPAVRLRHLRIDETGEFMDRWPKGFFEERAEELF
jgi:hypothetical protein